jgi:diguanylate cyclase (GGDEF)-like protein/PAS domain S-box-containing protein
MLKPPPASTSLRKARSRQPSRRKAASFDAKSLLALLDAIALPIFAKDNRNRYTFANMAACRFLGRRRDEIIGTRDDITTAPHSAAALLDNQGREHRLCVEEDDLGRGVGLLLDVSNLRDTELAFALGEKRLELLVMNLPLMIHAHDAAGRIVFWNRECERVLGYTASEVIGNPAIFERFYPDADYRSNVRAQHEVGKDFHEREITVRAADGSERILSWSLVSNASPLPGWATWETGRDITARRRAERLSREFQHRAQKLIEASPMGMHIYRLAQDGRLLLAGSNPSADKILHRGHAELIGRTIEEVFPELAASELPERFRQICREGGQWKNEQIDYRDDGIAGAWELHCFQIEPGACAAMFLDLTERKLMETRLRHLALHDPLTGIANRSLCAERIDTALQRARRRADYKYAVIYLDLDRFKLINDTMGHTVGDAVLVETAQRLRASVRELDTVARMGGDEFVVLMEEFDSYKRPIQAINRIRAAMREPFRAQGHEFDVTASIGVALGRTPLSSAEEALRNANLAMHRAKAKGRNRVMGFNQNMLTETLNVVRLENDMGRAMAKGEFFLEFQPIIQLGKRERLFGFEALARWRHPERGLIMPGEFIPVAEDSGQVVELGYWALREGSRTLSRWRERYPHLGDAMLSVNLSPQQVPRADFLPRMRDILQETGLPAKNLKLEVTETALMQSGPAVLNKLEELRDMGVTFSVDDFGTGYSSLAYLTRLPLDHLKIDLSFVRMLENGRENLEIVRAIIQLATSLRMDVVAEGVENITQQDILRELGCEYFQGFLFARPLPELKAEEFLRRFAPACGGLDGLGAA